ncbi:MAG: DNA-3-methyladenine glycosylase [Aggregatilineales bacterium]
MSDLKPLPRDFYAQHATQVARQLLGATLVRRLPGGGLICAKIVETEAYSGTDDLASHGRAKRTPRNLPMYGAPGHAYVYLAYGIHWLLNVVAEPVDTPAAVLIRAVQPLEGIEHIASRQDGRPPYAWTSGPARLTVALSITGAHNTLDMTTMAGGLWIASGEAVPDSAVRTGPRIGLGKRVSEPWLSVPWRWWIAGNPYVSRA